MTFLTLIFRNFYYYRRKNTLTFLGIMLSTGVIIGTLTLGDSVKFTLHKIVQERLGGSEFAVVSNNRFFQTSLAKKLHNNLKNQVVPVLHLKGFASDCSENKRIQQVQVYGVNTDFWNIGKADTLFDNLLDDEVIINQSLARRLNLVIDDEILLKIQQPHIVPIDAPFVPDDKEAVSKRMHVKAIASENQFGNFNLQNNQVAPANIFVSLSVLNKFLSLKNVSNVLLIGGENHLSENYISREIKKCWTLADFNLKFRKIQKLKQFELISDRIFIEDTILNIVRNTNLNCYPVFTYLVNSFYTNNHETPYSFCASPAETIDSNINDYEIIINEWMASDLNVKIGDSITLAYYKLGSFKKLKDENCKFKIILIVPIKGASGDSLLMPEFEGLANVNRCKDWNTGIPIDLKKIRQKDEDYWNRYRGTPKAFISYKTAKKIWGTTFGNCTAIRLIEPIDTNKLVTEFLQKLNPQNIGMQVVPVKRSGSLSANEGIDFSQLFISLSFLLILAAVILSALLLSLNIDLRKKEMGILSALGIADGKIKMIFVVEGIFIAFFAIIGGVACGIFLNQIVLYFLNNIWSDIVRTSNIQIHVQASSVFIGCAVSFVFALITILITISKKSVVPIYSIHKFFPFNAQKQKKSNRFIAVVLFICFITTITILLLARIIKMSQNPMLFYFAGILILVYFYLFIYLLLQKIAKEKSLNVTVFYQSFNNILYRRKRSLLQICLISLGVFLIVSTGFNRTDFSKMSAERQSGSGGFQLYAETSLPILYDLNTKKGRNSFNIPESSKNLSFVQLKALNGDDASCLNLNRVAKPRIVAVNPDEFIRRKAFSFTQTDKITEKKNPWEVLKYPLGRNVFAAIADQSVITWGLGKSVGDTIKYLNEKGDTIFFKLIAGLENSIFQGNLIIAQNIFIDNFPDVGGSNIFLVDATNICESGLKQMLENNFQNVGIIVSSTKERLALFYSVTNTYLDIFISLGGIALILSLIGTAVLIARVVNEQKSELAMLQAMGISRYIILKIIFIENGLILFTGIVVGTVSAVVATIPSIVSNFVSLPVSLISTLLIACLLNGTFWIYFISSRTLNKDILQDLRNN